MCRLPSVRMRHMKVDKIYIMKPSEVIEQERKREDSSTWNKIYLHKDGSFYHAYEWSAWLIKQLNYE